MEFKKIIFLAIYSFLEWLSPQYLISDIAKQQDLNFR